MGVDASGTSLLSVMVGQIVILTKWKEQHAKQVGKGRAERACTR